MTTATLKTLSLLGLASLTFACGQPGEFEDADLTGDDVGTTASALCQDAPANHSAAIGSAEGSTVGATSPDASYGSAQCSGRFIVEASATSGKAIMAAAGFGDVPTTQSACGSTKITATVYGQKWKLNPYPQRPTLVWQQIGPEKSAFGQWTSFFGGPGFCTLAPNALT